MNDQKRSDRFSRYSMELGMSALAVFLTWFLHEYGHWSVSELLGYPSYLRINSVGPKTGSYLVSWHSILVSISGPLVTVAQAVLVFTILLRRWNPLIYYFCFTPFYMRLLAAGMNAISLNDEGRVSADLGLPIFVVPSLVVFILGALIIYLSRENKLNAVFHLRSFVLVMIWSSLLIMYDQFYVLRFI